MKRITSLLVAFIAISVYSGFAADSTKAQTSFKNYVINTDTILAKKAGPAFSINVSKDANPDKFILHVINPLAEKLYITVSANSTSGFREQTSEVSYKVRVDMTNAADDYYTITVRNKKQEVVKYFRLETSETSRRSIVIE